MARRKGSKDYPLDIKLEAVRLFYEEGLPQRQIKEQLGIRDVRRVKRWMQIYRNEGVTGLKKRRRGRPPKKDDQAAYIRQLEMENALLKKYHTDLREKWLAKRNIGQFTITEENTQ